MSGFALLLLYLYLAIGNYYLLTPAHSHTHGTSQIVVHAFSRGDAPEFKKDMEYAIRWIARHSNYRPVEPPYAILSTPAGVRSLFGHDRPRADRVAAFYNDNWSVAVLPYDYGIDLLVHEMVHHLQNSWNRRFRCWADSEREAYYFENMWRRQQGLPERDVPEYVRLANC